MYGSGRGEQEVGVASGSGWNLWVHVATGCGCKEVYRFPHTTYPYSSCICSFLQQHPYFLFIFKMFFVLVHNSTCRTFACTDLRSLLSRPYVCALRVARYAMFHNNKVQSSSPVQQSNPVITDAHYIPKPPISAAVQSV